MSCVECSPIQLRDGEEKLYTFYDDVSQNPAVIKVMLSVSQAMQKVFNSVDVFVDTWRRYDSEYALWNHKKLAHLERMRNRKTSIVNCPRLPIWKCLPLTRWSGVLRHQASALCLVIQQGVDNADLQRHRVHPN